MRYVDACDRGAWHLELWRRDGSSQDRLAVPFRCRSWRHAGECRAWCGACDFVRVRGALRKYKTWSYLVLTYPHRDWPRKKLPDLFRFGVKSWGKLRKRMIEQFGTLKYVQTWEIHKSQYPHCNVVIANKSLQVHATEADRRRAFRKPMEETFDGWFTQTIQNCGFGKQYKLSSLHNRSLMAGYLTKLANELTGAAVKDQVPVNAPRHFRRLRASIGLLEKRGRSGEFTGRLNKFRLPQPLDVEGGEISLAEFDDNNDDDCTGTRQLNLF